ncbi:hypothetical protein F4811DRAFT_2441 [Daldinia bambusicola]|nr:hypothetical protein F4811DRAFT_2441 [Daldinia bambusicola]
MKMKKLITKINLATRSSSSSHPSSSSRVLRPASDARSDYKTTSYSSLELLPPEIRRHILSFLDIRSLDSLIHSSPVFHEQYLENRRYLLCSSLETTLGAVALDAWATFQSGSPGFSYTRENVQCLLESFRVNGQPLHERIKEHEAIEMATFYLSIISPLIHHYTKWILDNFATEIENIPKNITLSPVEETRVLRSFYRFQLGCNLFGSSDESPCTKQGLYLRPIDILRLFFCQFEPWEVEEILCINTFARDKYDKIFREIHWDVNENNPKFDGQRPPTPEGAFDFDNSWAREELLAGTVCRGLELLHKATYEVKDHSQLVQTMQENIAWPSSAFLTEFALGEAAQWERRQEAFSKRDEKQNRRDSLPFTQDAESYPPLAWTMIWGGTYSNLYGWYVHDNLRRLGYVFLDAITIESLGAKDIILKKCQEDWGDNDPRDRIF